MDMVAVVVVVDATSVVAISLASVITQVYVPAARPVVVAVESPLLQAYETIEAFAETVAEPSVKPLHEISLVHTLQKAVIKSQF